jgi:hypothetical protein
MSAALLLGLSTAAPARAQDSSRTQPLTAGLTSGIDLFKSLRASWRSEVVDPLARLQATRALRQLSNALDDLALQKQELAEAVEIASRKNDFNAVRGTAEDLAEQTRALRRRLQKVFRTMPSVKQQDAGKIEASISLGMSTKWESLNAVAQELGLSNPTVASVRAETAKAVQLTYGMKAQVDSLISDMQKADRR